MGVKLYSVNILSAIHALLGTLLSISSRSKLVDDVQCSRITVSEEVCLGFCVALIKLV